MAFDVVASHHIDHITSISYQVQPLQELKYPEKMKNPKTLKSFILGFSRHRLQCPSGTIYFQDHFEYSTLRLSITKYRNQPFCSRERERRGKLIFEIAAGFDFQLHKPFYGSKHEVALRNSTDVFRRSNPSRSLAPADNAMFGWTRVNGWKDRSPDKGNMQPVRGFYIIRLQSNRLRRRAERVRARHSSGLIERNVKYNGNSIS